MGFTEPTFDCNLPEFLAVDLEKSASVFAKKQLTSGAPSPALTDDGSRRRYSLHGSSLTAGFASHQYHDAMPKVHSLRAADEKYSPFTLRNNDLANDPSDSEDTASESSGGMEAPSIRQRANLSVTTAATSVLSGRGSTLSYAKLQSPVETSSPEKSPLGTWVDMEREGYTSTTRRHSFGYTQRPPLLSSGKDDIQGDLRTMSLRSTLRSHRSVDLLRDFVPPVPVVKSSQKATTRGRPALNQMIADIPQRSSSLRSRRTKASSSPSKSSSSPRPRVSPNTSRTKSSPAVPATPPKFIPKRGKRKKRTPSPLPPREDDQASQVISESADSFDLGQERPRPSREQKSATAISSSLVNVEQWLESSVQTGGPLGADCGFTGVPLPQDTLDTLKISVTNFPETMLLCTSLSIETIRSSARRLKHDNSRFDFEERLMSIPDSLPTRTSKWKWFSSRRSPSPQRESASTQSKPAKVQSRFLEPPAYTHPASMMPPPNWTSFKGIFPASSDYLCDALYAHILAYNYITSLCPRSPTSPTTMRFPSSRTSGALPSLRRKESVDSTRVPRKAASLLGIDDADHGRIPFSPSLPTTNSGGMRASHPNGRPPPMLRRRSGSTDSSLTIDSLDTLEGNAPDQAMKELRLGLARCIARLMATLRMPATEKIDTPLKGDDKDISIDPMFIRALCEIVRSNEEK